jgi:pimeloyl-ACP methyl ester carboxylesterase
MLSLKNERIWLSLALLGLLACSDDDKGTKTDDEPVETADAGSEPTCEDATGGVQDEPHPGDNDTNVLPIIFVHGFVGSASQFDSQAQRLVANDYPPSKLHAYDHDGVVGTAESFADGLDTLVNTVLAKHNTTQFILIGHSRGTSVSNTYLGNPERAKKVKKVVLLDGRPCGTAVPCDAPNQMNLPGQAHVEVATSAESFKRWYKFLFDKEPSVADIVKQEKPVQISGRAVNFPANTGRVGATLDVYELDHETGQRVSCSLATVVIDQSGDWGPVKVDPDKYYELVLSLENGGFQHFYFQRFLRSTKFIRLLSGPPDSPARMNTNSGPEHAALTVIRMREWYATDTLDIKVDLDGDVTNVGNTINPDDIGRGDISVYLHDDAASPKQTTLAPLPYFGTQPFQAGYDAYLPVSEPEKSTITVTNIPRGETAKPQVLTFPSWPSDKHTTMVMYADFAQ